MAETGKSMLFIAKANRTKILRNIIFSYWFSIWIINWIAYKLLWMRSLWLNIFFIHFIYCWAYKIFYQGYMAICTLYIIYFCIRYNFYQTQSEEIRIFLIRDRRLCLGSIGVELGLRVGFIVCIGLGLGYSHCSRLGSCLWFGLLFNIIVAQLYIVLEC